MAFRGMIEFYINDRGMNEIYIKYKKSCKDTFVTYLMIY